MRVRLSLLGSFRGQILALVVGLVTLILSAALFAVVVRTRAEVEQQAVRQMRSAADTGASMVAVSLVHRRGYFQQHLDAAGQQTETDVPRSPETTLPFAGECVTFTMQDRSIKVCAWRFDVVGVAGHIIPVFLLDTDVEGNDPWDRTLTDHLYGGDTYYRL